MRSKFLVISGIYTESQKKIPAIISRSLVKHCPILIILADMFLRKFSLKRWFNFAPHLASVSALPGKQKSVNLTHFVLYISVLVLDMKMGETFGLETKGFYHWANIQHRTTRFTLRLGPNHLLYTRRSNFQQVTNGVSCHEWWKYLRACICAQRR